jgi:Isochorismatase family
MTGTVVICGVSTSVGVEATARQGTGLGFAFVVVEDACGAMVVEEHEYAVKTIFPRLAKVRSTDQVIAALALPRGRPLLSRCTQIGSSALSVQAGRPQHDASRCTPVV